MKKLKKTGFVVVAALLLLMAATFLLKGYFLRYAVSKVQQKAMEKYNLSLHIDRADISGVTHLVFAGIAVVPPSGDTLFTAEEVNATLRFSSLLTGSIRFSSLAVRNTAVTLLKRDSADNYSFLWKKKKASGDSIRTSVDYGAFLREQIENSFDKTPDNLLLENTSVVYRAPSDTVRFSMPRLSIGEGLIRSEIFNHQGGDSAKWIAEGEIRKGDRHSSIRLYAESGNVLLPYIGKKYKAKVAFDTLQVELSEEKYSRGTLRLKGNAHISNLLINHPRLALSEDIIIRYGQVDYDLAVTAGSLTLDSGTVMQLNSIRVKPYLAYEHYPARKVQLKASMEPIAANDFFASLPEGMFHTLKGMQATGSLSYGLSFALDPSNPDSVRFDSRMEKQGFKILKFGSEYLPKLNTSFSYTAYEKGHPVKTFTVGPENPDFTPLSEISPYLRGAVLTSEDGSFFFHRGFNEEAFRKAIADNLKKGRFARGGSTISMQLVKNIFLSRNKTIARKLEEALIVWLIENNYLCSKERMYEVYLNIIEWGPGIYGVKEASQFYFSKNPGELTLPESIFLASIIPSPKGFKYSFEAGGYLKPRLYGYFRLVSAHMLKKQYITEEEYSSLFPNIELKGPARQYIIPSDYLPEGLFTE
jgi:hypothetical protein